MTAIASDARFDMGRVVKRTLGAVGRNWAAFGILAFLFGVIPQGLLQSDRFGAFSGGARGLGLGFGLVLAAASGSFILEGALTFGVVADLDGRRPSVGECLSVGLRSIFPLLGLGVLMTMGIVLGLVLLIVPGVLMILAWIVAAPAMVVERTGIFEAFTRSSDLTRHHRGAILVLVIAYWLLSVAISSAVDGLSSAAMGMENPPIWIRTAVAALVQGVQTLVGAAGAASIYFELRSIKEGVGPESLAAVFD